MDAAQGGETDPTAERRYTVVVALSNPSHVDQLMRTAVDFSRGTGGRIEVVSVIHKHASSPFLLFEEELIKAEYSSGQQEVLERAVQIAEQASIPVGEHLLVGQDISDAILSLLPTVDADALLLGWQRRSRPADIVLGTTVDPLVRRAPCDVFIERIGTTADGMDEILLPTAGGPHDAASTTLAGSVASATDARISVVSYVPPEATAETRSACRAYVESAMAALSNVRVEGGVAEADDVAGAIVDDARHHDLVVLGATRERRLQNRLVGSVAATVAEQAPIPVIISKRYVERSLLDRAKAWWQQDQSWTSDASSDTTE